ncbi:hypothetical protein EJ06DRAFT_574629 [Trichodelitschia bisporula]|uniref:GPN-loop GTPase 3 n=1 Tax=Trichodelitschia bisporula TaxID=703511 RepID=A0A6G1I2S0_9PEZI|nr:hypothetical protein EJ06DRAFT_574629 [Trichodelitschia bisporula]
MSKFGVMVMGPAGAGKTTFCTAMMQHLSNTRRSFIYVNLDPAAEQFGFEPDVDIKDLVSLEDVMEEMDLGPNGGLIFCFEYLLENLDFLTNKLETVGEDYLIVFDMPGQIELYTHVPILPVLTRHLREGSLNISLCAAYLLEATFIADRAKFFAGTLSAMSAMLMLGIPHVNILSKMDLVKGTVARRELRRFIQVDTELLDDDPTMHTAGGFTFADNDEKEDPAGAESILAGASFAKLNHAVGRLIDDFSLVSFLQLDAQDEDSIGGIVSYIDDAIQFHEAQEPREPKELEPEFEE